MTGFRADPDRLAARARDFQGLAETAEAIVAELTGELEAAGRCWGSDDVGQSFAATHVAAADDALRRLGALGGQLADVGVRFTDLARSYRDADDSGARAIGAADV